MEMPNFLQVYLLDLLDDKISARSVENMRNSIIDNLLDWLRLNNELIRKLQTAHERMLEHEHFEHIKIVINEDARPAGEHSRRYNAHQYHFAE